MAVCIWYAIWWVSCDVWTTRARIAGKMGLQILGSRRADRKIVNVAGQAPQLIANVIMQLAGYFATLIFLSLHKVSKQVSVLRPGWPPTPMQAR